MTDDLWQKFLKRLRQYAYERCGIQGYSELTITLALDHGKLIGWTSPTTTRWEPTSMAEELCEIAVSVKGLASEP